jgi:hypothetical protein
MATTSSVWMAAAHLQASSVAWGVLRQAQHLHQGLELYITAMTHGHGVASSQLNAYVLQQFVADGQQAASTCSVCEGCAALSCVGYFSGASAEGVRYA